MDKETIDGMKRVGYIDIVKSEPCFDDIINALEAVELMKLQLETIEQHFKLHDVCSCGTCAELTRKKTWIKQTLGPIGSAS